MTKPITRKRPTPEDYALSGTEEAHQISLFMKAADNVGTYPDLKFLFHVPNGGFRNKATAGKLKAMGVKTGVPDVFLLVKRGEFAGLIIELKRPAKIKVKREGRASPEQNEWIEKLRQEGYGAAVCVGWEAAWSMIVEYLNYRGKVFTPELHKGNI